MRFQSFYLQAILFHPSFKSPFDDIGNGFSWEKNQYNCTIIYFWKIDIDLNLKYEQDAISKECSKTNFPRAVLEKLAANV